MTVTLNMPQAWSRFGPPVAPLRGPLLAAVAYFVGAEAAFLVGTLSDRIFAPFWPPNVILFCVLLLAPRPRWWLYLAAALPAHMLAELQVAMPPLPMAVAFATNCAIALLGALAVRRELEGSPWLGSLKKASIYVLVTALAAPAAVAFGGAFVPILAGGAHGHYWIAWAQWFLANSLGFLTLGPIFLTWFAEGPRPWSILSPWRLMEAVAIAVALVAVCALAFHLDAGGVEIGFMPALLYSPLPLILWAAVRFGAKGASGAIFVVTVVLLWLALNSSSFFLAGDPSQNVLALQIFLIGLSIPVLLLGAAIDEVRRAEAATRESEERMRFAAASANIGLWYFERASGQFWMTEHCREMLGLAPDAPLTPELVQRTIHPDDRKSAVQSMRSAAYAGHDVVSEFRVVLPGGGGLRWVRARARADHDRNGMPFRVSGLFMDITAVKAADQDAEIQRRELAHLMRVSVMGELSGAIAHELNQPLTAILSNAQAARLLLAGSPVNLAEITDAVGDIEHESKRAGEVIERMRGLLKKGEHRPEPFDVNELIRSTVDLLHSEIIARRLKVDLQLAPALPQSMGDAVQLQQVLLNLLLNAMDAMAATPLPRRAITVSTRLTPDNALEVSVIDGGPGLTLDAETRAFNPFFTTKPHGLGLGLSICSTIVSVHGGQLGLVNNVGGGAKASFTVPVRPVILAAAK
ncbi:MAG TPA: MASE1 domain-containing protein [Xanthobacteraceae bacterium]|nr:MASE1 domain-containing protein [Xanthobacteraceae bacterium]